MVLEQNIAVKRKVDPAYREQGMTYEEYRRLIDALIMVGRSTAHHESANLLEYSKLNVVRMKRLDKTLELLPELQQVVEQVSSPQTWLVLTEGWCGDAAQIIPVLHKIEQLNPNITLRMLLRDAHPELMDAFLTNGRSRSIPKLIALNAQSEVLFTFGPRPTVLQELFYHMKANAMGNDAVKEEIHRWYAQDKTFTTQQELLVLLKDAVSD